MKKPFLRLFAGKAWWTTILFLSFVVNGMCQLTQWRGPNRDGIFSETGLLKVWPEEGPQRLWITEGVGKGWSSPIVTDRNIFVTGMIDSKDVISCFDLNGKMLWQVPYGTSWEKSYPDTRGSATIEGDLLWLISGSGELVCLSALNGDQMYESEWHNWGVSESPLIVDDLVICTPGGKLTSVVAFNKITGEEVWRSESLGGQRSYVSPVIYEYLEHRMILAATATHLMALDPGTGRTLWSYLYYDQAKWSRQPGLIWINTPVIHENRIFLSKGYNYHAVMLEMNQEAAAVTEVFRDSVLDNHHHGLILHEGYLYGSNWLNNGKGHWACMRWSDGEIMWEHDWHNKGALVFADGMFYAYEEKSGHVGLIEPAPEGIKLISEFQVTEGTGPHWAHPFIAHGNLYLRHGEVLMAYKIR